ncbi:MAG: hypothetical protein Q9204_008235 [Flavoplaca sp. TL-2023a]
MYQVIAPYQAHSTADANCEDIERTDLEDNPSFPQTKLDAFKDFDAEARNPGHISNCNSLQILQKSHQTNVLVNEPMPAANVAPSESIEASSQQKCGEEVKGQDDAQLASFDYNGSELISNKIHKINSNSSLIVEEFAATVLDDVPTHTDTRLLVIDNLSQNLIYILRTCLPISLEFFEEHLLNAGWQNNHYEDMSFATFNTTADFAKDYVSVRWFRPIRARNLRPNAERQSQRMLEPSATPDIWEEQLSEQKHFEHSTRPLVNILRLPWEASLGSAGFYALEERASVWSTQHGQVDSSSYCMVHCQ